MQDPHLILIRRFPVCRGGQKVEKIYQLFMASFCEAVRWHVSGFSAFPYFTRKQAILTAWRRFARRYPPDFTTKKGRLIFGTFPPPAQTCLARRNPRPVIAAFLAIEDFKFL
ncbi:MAG: hypothetical protein U1F16_08195 [Turneriella sp.]